jgi:hypothetical protein
MTLKYARVMKETPITSKCILCTSAPPGHPEHVLPDVLGGRLKVPILCNKCNLGRGAELVATVKKDPSIRLAVEALQNRFPDFARKFLEKAQYAGRVPDGSLVQTSRRGNRLEVLPSKGTRDSIILDTQEAEKALAKKLRRSRHSPEVIANYIKYFSELGEEEPLTIPTGETFIKRPLPRLTPQLGNTFVDNRLFALMALEFSALILGDRVLRPSFDYAREYILGADSTDFITARQLLARQPYEPIHTLMLREKDGLLAVQIRLFSCIAGEVIFSNIAYQGIDPIYLEDLETTRSYYAPDRNHANQNQWLLIK